MKYLKNLNFFTESEKYIKTFEKLVDTPIYNINDYVFIIIGEHNYYGQILEIDDLPIDNESDDLVFTYFIKILDESFENLKEYWVEENDIDRLMNKNEIINFKNKIEFLENMNKYNI